MNLKMRIVLSGGGTSGHINPAIAIAKEIRERDKNAEILFIGTKRGLEHKLVPYEKFDIKYINVRGLSRSLSPANLWSALLFIVAVFKSKSILKKFKPDVVAGTGGYVCGAVLYAAAKMGIKTVVHESNAYAGLTTKFLAKYVDKVLIGMPLARSIGNEDKVVLVGNPIKSEILKGDSNEAKKKLNLDERPLVVSVGGSRGAAKINEAVLNMLVLSQKDKMFNHIHGTGKADFDNFSKIAQEKGLVVDGSTGCIVKEYIYDMPMVYAAADIIICRAGASTIAEVSALGKPCIIIPSPNVTDNHQFYNAKSLSDSGAAVMLEDKELTGKFLYDTVCKLAFDSSKKAAMKENALKFSKPNALNKTVDIITKLANK